MKRTVLALLLALAAGSASAEMGVGLRAGTTGIGADYGYKLTDSISARIGYSAYNYSTDVTQTDVKYNAKLKLSNFSALADWNIIGGFRLTGGLVGQGNKIDIDGTPSGGTYTINGTVYQASELGTLNGRIKAGNSVSPYLGIGYGTVAGAGVNFYADLGVMYQGSPKVNLSATCSSSLPSAQCSQLQSDVAAEQDKLKNDIKAFKWYPVLSVGVTIGF